MNQGKFSLSKESMGSSWIKGFARSAVKIALNMANMGCKRCSKLVKRFANTVAIFLKRISESGRERFCVFQKSASFS